MTREREDAERQARARIAARWVGLIIPITILLASGVVVLVWLPGVPDPSALHWSGGSGPDGFGPAWLNVLPIIVGIVLVAAFAWLPVVLSRAHLETPGPAALTSGQLGPAATTRLLSAVNVGLAVLMGAVSVASVASQRGLENAADAADITPWIAIAGGAAVLIAIIGWLVQPRVSKKGEWDV